MGALHAGIATAQTAALFGTTAPSLLISLEPTPALPDSGTPGDYLIKLRPLGNGLGKNLADHGVCIAAKDFAEPLDNISGGIKRGGPFEGSPISASTSTRTACSAFPAAPSTS